jgi:hypothetical protein
VGDDIVTLNVGGTRYQTRRDSLLSLPGTYFTKLLAGREGEATAEFFIDRDGAKFGPILNYLRYSFFSLLCFFFCCCLSFCFLSVLIL